MDFREDILLCFGNYATCHLFPTQIFSELYDHTLYTVNLPSIAPPFKNFSHLILKFSDPNQQPQC
jgi:hypothetical protein